MQPQRRLLQFLVLEQTTVLAFSSQRNRTVAHIKCIGRYPATEERLLAALS